MLSNSERDVVITTGRLGAAHFEHMLCSDVDSAKIDETEVREIARKMLDGIYEIEGVNHIRLVKEIALEDGYYLYKEHGEHFAIAVKSKFVVDYVWLSKEKYEEELIRTNNK